MNSNSIEQGRSLPTRETLSRRKLLETARAIIVGSAIVGAFEKAIGHKRFNLFIDRLFLNSEQRQAIDQFNSAKEEERILLLRVGEDGANLRTTPNSEFDNEKGANLRGRLEPGTRVIFAIEVLGNDPYLSGRQRRKEWYFIPKLDPYGNAVDGYFAYSGNFVNNQGR